MAKVLSVIIPVYNVEKYIKECLESVSIPELTEELEVLIINDGSNDHSPEIAQEFVCSNPKIFRLISKENGGHGSAINTGIHYATGAYLKVVDGDDWVDKESLCRLISFLKRTSSDLVCTKYCWVREASGKMSLDRKQFPRGIHFHISYPFSELSKNAFIKMHNMTIKTDLMQTHLKPLDRHCFYVDNEFILYPIPYINTISFLPDVLYRYRVGQKEQSVNIHKMQERCAEHEHVLCQLLCFYKEQRGLASEVAVQYLERGIAKMACSQIKIYLSSPPSETERQKIVRLEGMLRSDYSAVFKSIRHPAILLLRASHYYLYRPGAYILRLFYKV